MGKKVGSAIVGSSFLVLLLLASLVIADLETLPWRGLRSNRTAKMGKGSVTHLLKMEGSGQAKVLKFEVTFWI